MSAYRMPGRLAYVTQWHLSYLNNNLANSIALANIEVRITSKQAHIACTAAYTGTYRWKAHAIPLAAGYPREDSCHVARLTGRLEGCVPCCQLKDKHSKCPVVNAPVVPTVENELRREVLRRATHREGLGVQLLLAVNCDRVWDALCEPQIDDSQVAL